MNPSRLFILRPVATSLLMVGDPAGRHRRLPLAAALGAARGRLPDDPGADASIPGASPDVMTSSVTAPLERQFGQMPGPEPDVVDQLGGRLGRSRCSSASTSALDVAEQEVQAAINAAGNLLPARPAGAADLRKVNPADAPILTLALTSKTLPLTAGRGPRRHAARAEDLAAAGRRPGQHQRRPAARRCASRPIRRRSPPTASTSTTCAPRSRNANVNQPKGNFDGPTRAYTIDANDQLQIGRRVQRR